MKRKWHHRPVFWICVILGAAALAAFLTRPPGRREDGVLRSSIRTTPDGIAALSRGIARMGRHTEPRLTPFAGADPVRGTIATLQAQSMLSPREVEAVLDHVRDGGTFLYAPPVQELSLAIVPMTTPLLVALGFRIGEASLAPSLRGGDWLDRRLIETEYGEIPTAEVAWAGHALAEGLPPPAMPRFGLLEIKEEADSAGAEEGVVAEDEGEEGDSVPAVLPPGWPDAADKGPMEPILTISLDSGEELIAAALVPLGEGRVIVFADVSPLANSKAGDDPLAVLAVRAALAFTSEADTVFFDEFHQGITGYGSQATVLANFFLGSPGGRTLLHVVLVWFAFLACKGLRFGVPTTAVAPADRERRSPLEHVSALGDLYRKARATNTAALLLLSRLAASLRRPPPRDMEGAGGLLRELRAREGDLPSLEPLQLGPDAEPADLTQIAAVVDEHLSRRFSK